MNIRQKQQENVQKQAEKEPQQAKKHAVNAQELLENKHLQFECENGVIMANMLSGIDKMIGLKYHKDRTTDFNGFIESIEIFMSATNSELTAKDVSRLKIEYKK